MMLTLYKQIKNQGRSSFLPSLYSLVFAVLFSTHLVAQEQQTLANEWQDWDQTLLEIDIYTLPLTPQQQELINQRINKLKQQFGVGITGEIEQAINQMDSSNMLDEPITRAKKFDQLQLLARDDLMLEEEILALEFADSVKSSDPEGLKRSAIDNQVLFERIIKKLAQLEQNALKKKANKSEQ